MNGETLCDIPGVVRWLSVESMACSPYWESVLKACPELVMSWNRATEAWNCWQSLRSEDGFGADTPGVAVLKAALWHLENKRETKA